MFPKTSRGEKANPSWFKDKDSVISINLYEIFESHVYSTDLPRIIVWLIGQFVEGTAKYYRVTLLGTISFEGAELRRVYLGYSTERWYSTEEVSQKWLAKWRRTFIPISQKLEINLGGERTIKNNCWLADWSNVSTNRRGNIDRGHVEMEAGKVDL